ncbi:hypothetical protein FEM33_01525 [Dyadobacter flavalbus]|uniref:Uncharacterized protein n=1 Tax=Dyadobacter flavalbus TaxID=2579942 RepID=A0A5M8R2A0_9BACT|nr:hypothetical protein [Dyadobacter flavalbus]KAA6441440.1 hypothetical protein FEM33_01525 [Dyadobacter flavalbus]
MAEVKKQVYAAPKKPIPIQIRLALSMLYQVKDMLEIKKWMSTQDIFEAHSKIFRRISASIQHDYNYAISVQQQLNAIELLMAGFNKDDILK